MESVGELGKEDMKILVFDDSKIHQESARLTLKEHSITVVGTYDEAQEALLSRNNFDAVLTDLMVPASRQAQGGPGLELVGQEMPLGTTIALLALSVGVKNVAVVTDMNHHHNPASAAFDCFGRIDRNSSKGFNLMCTNNVRYIQVDSLTGEVLDPEFLESKTGLKKYPYPKGQSWGERKNVKWLKGKDWGHALTQLLSEYKHYDLVSSLE